MKRYTRKKLYRREPQSTQYRKTHYLNHKQTNKCCKIVLVENYAPGSLRLMSHHRQSPKYKIKDQGNYRYKPKNL